ncbi:16S rRNA (guanine(966)-N(2))-methyltransferase RsmD [Phaeobacter sp. 22II1-1F12B]|uniref:16S rRNA (guanine(966)-N(2))-methyltransferase RsmD n=1 Tax=Phaeobacter sp. 22II1-1F12B TaxID=1317111 RepID=UPI000B51F4EB|nr:16S rRNA (guanine(966)-N(2))-methyltransferase RsmD [Phaeobacter sp. 22II1-1F12B]OWU82466.1 DNA methyltransferase [Phaeobacter sp. 22II1-1F12B]
MRIIAGRYRGRALTPVGKGDAGAHLRPTTDRVRESLFSVLMSLDVLDGARVLDLFAGTGALGLEALSRGAEHATFAEKGRVGQGLIGKNIALLRAKEKTRVIRQDATRLPDADAPCDLVFLDPPYGQGLGVKALESAAAGGWIADGALIVWEESTPQEAPDGFKLHDRRKYGDTHVTLLWYGAA